MTLKTRIERLERQRRSSKSLTITRLEQDEHGCQWLSVVRRYPNGDQLTVQLPTKLPFETWVTVYGK
jgi:hypothetical protein